jgi:hypothetical protein
MSAREAFVEAVEAYSNWLACQPVPTIPFEGGEIPISEACRLVETCQSSLPKGSIDTLKFCDVELKTRTYAGAAHALLLAIRKMRKSH